MGRGIADKAEHAWLGLILATLFFLTPNQGHPIGRRSIQQGLVVGKTVTKMPRRASLNAALSGMIQGAGELSNQSLHDGRGTSPHGGHVQWRPIFRAIDGRGGRVQLQQGQEDVVGGLVAEGRVEGRIAVGVTFPGQGNRRRVLQHGAGRVPFLEFDEAKECIVARVGKILLRKGHGVGWWWQWQGRRVGGYLEMMSNGVSFLVELRNEDTV